MSRFVELHQDRDSVWVRADAIVMIHPYNVTGSARRVVLTLHSGEEQAFDETPAEILALIAAPAVTVTEEMVERAHAAHVTAISDGRRYPSMRAALTAAFAPGDAS
jgi:hypothetical protein